MTRKSDKQSSFYAVHPVGFVRSSLRAAADAPKQGSEGAPDAWIEIEPQFSAALDGVVPGDELIVITFLHEDRRDILRVHPRGDTNIPLTGVFRTRSPHRPNPLGLHRVSVHEISGTRLLVGPLEAIDGTPVVDLKVKLERSGEA